MQKLVTIEKGGGEFLRTDSLNNLEISYALPGQSLYTMLRKKRGKTLVFPTAFF